MTHLLMGGNHHVVVMGSEELGLGAERFANGPFHAVSFDRGSARLERHSEAEVPPLVRNAEHHALGETEDLVPAKKFLELPRTQEPALPPKRGRAPGLCG